MKKFAFIIAVVFGTIVVSNAQDLKSKTGVPILPEAGDYAIGIDATPIFNFFGNFVKINSGAAFADPAAWNFENTSGATNNAIIGKYFTDAETAYRVTFRLGKTSVTTKNYVIQDGQTTPDPNIVVEDKQKVSSHNYIIGAGLEKHRGKGRLVGIYGAEFQFMMTGGKTKTEYGNAISSTNTTPTTTDFTTLTAGALPNNTQRNTEVKTGSGLGFGIRGFVGVEYFFAPKISVGGEFGWGLGFTKVGEGETTGEMWDTSTATPTLKVSTSKTAGSGTSTIDTDNLGGCINLIFHF